MRKILFYSKCLSKLFKSLIFMMVIIFASHAASKEGLPKNEVSVQKQNQILTQKNAILESENDILKGQNDRLSKSQRNTWFLYGALAVVMGSLLTSVLSSFSRKNKYDEWR